MDCATIAAMFRLRCLSLALSGLLLFCLAGSAHAREKRTRYVELQPMVGYSWVNLTGFSESRFVAAIDPSNVAPGTSSDDVANQHFDDGQVPVDGSGVSFGAALQLKLWVFVLGTRYAYTPTPDFGLHTIGGDLGLRLGKTVSLYGRLGPGYAFLDRMPPGINANGFVVSGSGGLEVRVGPGASLGFGLDTDLLLLASRRQLRAGSDALGGNATLEGLRTLDGSAVGFQLRPQLHFIWHI